MSLRAAVPLREIYDDSTLTASIAGAYNPATERGGAGAHGSRRVAVFHKLLTSKSESAADLFRLSIWRRVGALVLQETDGPPWRMVCRLFERMAFKLF